ncbi:MAG: molybdopterin dinucleotide binding domain-containing protein [Anaerolineales bacterium]
MAEGLGRRGFLKIGATGAATAVLSGCQSYRRWVNLEPFVNAPEDQVAGVANWYATTCRQCPAGCGVMVRVMNGRALKIEGNPQHPLNQGKTCARGQAALQVLYHPDRLAGPVEQTGRGNRAFKSISWNDGINRLIMALRDAGPRVMIWSGSQASDHVLDLFDHFQTALGAPEPLVFDAYSNLIGYRGLGTAGESSKGVPAYPLANADVVFSFGADFLGTWTSAVRYGVEYGRFRSQPSGQRGFLAQFEPRMSISGAVADRWVGLKPGTEATIAHALLALIAAEPTVSTTRASAAAKAAGDFDARAAADQAGVDFDLLKRLAAKFASAERPIAIPGPTMCTEADSGAGLDIIAALNSLNSDRGNATVDPAALPDFPFRRISPFADVSNALDSMRAGEVDVLLIHDANPIYELPSSLDVAGAFGHIPLVVSTAPIVDETAVQADLILPDRTALESWGYRVVSPSFSGPIVGSQQPIVVPEGDTIATGDLLLAVAHGLAATSEALPWTDEVAYLQERVSNLADGSGSGSAAPIFWARFLQQGGWWRQTTTNRHEPTAAVGPVASKPTTFIGDASEYPYYLHLYLSNLLSDGRGASQAWLQGSPDPMTTVSWQTWVELNPETANSLGLTDGDLVRIESTAGSIVAPVCLYPAIRPDTVAIPLGQGHSDSGRFARDRGDNPVKLIGAPDSDGPLGLSWGRQRVKIQPTGDRIQLARFENYEGVSSGFINQGFPGE